jgi:uncharacterized membrane protein YqgA involved in biofilm formation
MIIPWGSIFNCAVILVGGLIGLGLGDLIPKRVSLIVFQLFGLLLMPIGLGMLQKSPNLIPVLLSVILGGALGEGLQLGQWLENLGNKLKKVLKSKNPQFTNGLISSSIMVCVGAMAIVGSFEEGLGQGRTTVYTKSLIDFFTIIILASRQGLGVVLCAAPVLIYQGALTMTAAALAPLLTGPMVECLSATGGVMVMGIGVNMIGLKPPINISSVLPAIIFSIIISAIMS